MKHKGVTRIIYAPALKGFDTFFRCKITKDLEKLKK